jgi:hypothetical protein
MSVGLLVLIFLCISAVAGLFVDHWIWKLPPFRLLRIRSRQLLEEPITLDASVIDKLTVDRLSTHEHIGDKIVVVYHLPKAVDSFASSIREALWLGFIMALIVILFLVINRLSPQNASASQIAPQVVDAAKAYWLAPAAEFVAWIFTFKYYYILRDQIEAYRIVLRYL